MHRLASAHGRRLHGPIVRWISKAFLQNMLGQNGFCDPFTTQKVKPFWWHFAGPSRLPVCTAGRKTKKILLAVSALRAENPPSGTKCTISADPCSPTSENLSTQIYRPHMTVGFYNRYKKHEGIMQGFRIVCMGLRKSPCNFPDY
jgi:hypothetical protein